MEEKDSNKIIIIIIIISGNKIIIILEEMYYITYFNYYINFKLSRAILNLNLNLLNIIVLYK